MIKVSLEELLKTGAHFGHRARRWNPKMDEYLYGVQDGVHVFDLTKTKKMLEEALEAIKEAAKSGKTILIVGSKKQAREKVEEVAKATDSAYVTERWLGGTMTNFGQITKSIKKLADMKEKKEAGEYDQFTKKERILLDREIARLERFFGGIADLKAPPEMLVIVDIRKEIGAVKEAQMKGIKTVAIVDSNCDPNEVDYPIPMNDDATKALEYVLELVKDAILEGKAESKKKPVSKKKK